ncbi:MAG: M18 family aminopeptidase, partial [Spirochaetales bacterium]|nr:M18 family aminopeptidase [Candidatus Physcosoma equi]
MDTRYLSDTQQLTTFILKSPSPFHVVKNASDLLEAAGFVHLDETKPYNLKKGGSYYVTRNGSAVIAFRIPTSFDGFHIVSAHTDSPTLKIKWNPEVKGANLPTRLNVEVYGGMLLQSWFDRPLSIAGRVFVNRNGKMEERLVNLGQRLTVLIPNLAIHQNREANNGWKISVQKELLPLFSDKDDSFLEDVAVAAECKAEDILDYDLYLYNRTAPVFFGSSNSFFASPKIDDLGCSWSALEAITKTEAGSKIAMAALFDNEETGSGTRQGALSDFLQATTDRILSSLKIGTEEKYMLLASSRMVSADNGHAVHPNYPEKSDITNRPRMNNGVLLKYSANQKYTTDAESGAYIRM